MICIVFIKLLVNLQQSQLQEDQEEIQINYKMQ